MASVYDQYETVIGLEIHVQLSTQSKAFCADDARFGGAPNTHISAISLGHPGTLPKLNKQQAEYAIRLGLALGSRIQMTSTFDRKNYFYADLPKGYQITQDRLPICIGGSLEIKAEGQTKTIRIHHVHMEEDAGKSMHDQAPRHSLIDLNRAGVPLLEIVSEPDLRSANEVDAYMGAMRQLVRYLGISDGNMEEGSLRCDCNVSVRKKGVTTLGERCEIKNLNSMRYARRAIEYEVKRQIDLLESGEKVAQQTRHFDPDTGITTALREKEDAHDYRYFPEPDLPPVLISQSLLDELTANQPALPWQQRHLLTNNYGLPDYDAELLTEEPATIQYYLRLCSHTSNYKAAANLVINKLLPWCGEQNKTLSEFPCLPASLAEFIDLIDRGVVSNAVAYQRLLPAMIESPDQIPAELAQSLHLVQTHDTDALEAWVDQVIGANPDKVKAYKNGKKGLLGFFMGEVMRLSKGKAEPKASQALIEQKLD